jgi:hypothetical protein
MVISGVSPLGPRVDGQPDLERIRVAAGNPLRLVPWGDLTAQEAKALHRALEEIETLLREIAEREVASVREHMDLLRPRLMRGMKDLPAAERDGITDKLRGFSSATNDVVDVEGLVDIVGMLLGRHIEAEPDPSGDLSDVKAWVKELRSLDVLAFKKAEGDVHIANLSEGNFPASVNAVSWPFTHQDLREIDHPIPESIEILETRSIGSSAADLYLISIALDSVSEENQLRLSWISEISGETCRPSALLSLMTQVDSPSTYVRDRAGGLQSEVRSIGERQSSVTPPLRMVSAESNPKDEESLAHGLDPLAASSAYLCPRRVALQWIGGSSGAFRSEHLQSMLFGNVLGALYHGKLMGWEEAKLAVASMWRHLTAGQRLSSRKKARVKSPGADAAWIMNLSGSKQEAGSNPRDLAYRSAMGVIPVEFEILAPTSSNSLILPRGVKGPKAHEICRLCPVSPRCSQRVIDDRGNLDPSRSH